MHYIMEQGYHGLLVVRTSILQAEWHAIVGVSSPMGGECYLGFVLFSHLKLIITEKLIHKGEEHISRGIINQNVDI